MPKQVKSSMEQRKIIARKWKQRRSGCKCQINPFPPTKPFFFPLHSASVFAVYLHPYKTMQQLCSQKSPLLSSQTGHMIKSLITDTVGRQAFGISATTSSHHIGVSHCPACCHLPPTLETTLPLPSKVRLHSVWPLSVRPLQIIERYCVPLDLNTNQNQRLIISFF